MSAKQIAAVTGAAQGIGLAIATRLARDGFRVLAMDRNATELAAAVAALTGMGLDMTAAPIDVCDRASVAGALGSLSRIDVMVTAAGIYNDARFLDLTDVAFRTLYGAPQLAG